MKNIKKDISMISVEASWLDRCPVCVSGKLSLVTIKKLFGLVSVEQIECNNCKAIFKKEEGKYKNINVSDAYKSFKYYGSVLDENEWKSIAYGGKSDKELLEEGMHNFLNRLKDGTLPMKIIEVESPVILKKNEELYLCLPEISLLETRAVRVSTYGGPSIRVAKGIYYRLGNSQSESHEEFRTIDLGILILTNKRFIFSGSKKSISIDLKKIISVEPFSDAIGLRREGKEKTQYFKGFDQFEFSIHVKNKEYAELFSGVIVSYLIEGLIKNNG